MARTYRYATGALVLIALILVAAYLFTHRGASSASSQPASTTPYAVSLGNGGVVTKGGNATVTEQGAPKAPDFRTPLSFDASVSADARDALIKQFDATVEVLEKNRSDFSAWVNLGILRKVTGDYRGAASDWTYVAALYPASTPPSDNLGSLYLDYLKDYAKAEGYYKRSIANDPHDINAYENLFALYTTYGYKKGTSAGADLVVRGLKDNPGNQTLLQYQAQLSAR